MKTYIKIILFLIVLGVIALIIKFALISKNNTQNSNVNQNENSISDGTITVKYSKEFGLATNDNQILNKSYIPPCSEDFNYCIYYIGDAYKGTNFESAGIRIEKRIDLNTERLCQDTPPTGFDSTKLPSSKDSDDKYASSLFTNIGDAAAGHYSSGSLYRLYIKSKYVCYELESRIGESQFANYPPGTIKEFTAENRKEIQDKLNQIMYSAHQ
jgi:hypothetical protein